MPEPITKIIIVSTDQEWGDNYKLGAFASMEDALDFIEKQSLEDPTAKFSLETMNITRKE